MFYSLAINIKNCLLHSKSRVYEKLSYLFIIDVPELCPLHELSPVVTIVDTDRAGTTEPAGYITCPQQGLSSVQF